MGLRGKVRRRITSLYQHLSGAQQTDAVLAGQQDGLFHHPVTDRATQLLFHALHVGLERRGFGISFFKRSESANKSRLCRSASSSDQELCVNNGGVRIKERDCSRS